MWGDARGYGKWFCAHQLLMQKLCPGLCVCSTMPCPRHSGGTVGVRVVFRGTLAHRDTWTRRDVQGRGGRWSHRAHGEASVSTRYAYTHHNPPRSLHCGVSYQRPQSPSTTPRHPGCWPFSISLHDPSSVPPPSKPLDSPEQASTALQPSKTATRPNSPEKRGGAEPLHADPCALEAAIPLEHASVSGVRSVGTAALSLGEPNGRARWISATDTSTKALNSWDLYTLLLCGNELP